MWCVPEVEAKGMLLVMKGSPLDKFIKGCSVNLLISSYGVWCGTHQVVLNVFRVAVNLLGLGPSWGE